MAEPPPRALVLASASPFRRRMLEAAGLDFEVVPAAIDEPAVKARLGVLPPPALARALARAKAEEVSARCPDALVIGADQVLALGEEIMSKPASIAEARAQLLRLRARTHSLHTAVALALSGKIVWDQYDAANLTMRAFSEAFLDGYLAASGEGVCRMVGAYEVEGRGVQLFERIEGDTFTIIGLPLVPLLAELRARGIIAT